MHVAQQTRHDQQQVLDMTLDNLIAEYNYKLRFNTVPPPTRGLLGLVLSLL